MGQENHEELVAKIVTVYTKAESFERDKQFRL